MAPKQNGDRTLAAHTKALDLHTRALTDHAQSMEKLAAVLDSSNIQRGSITRTMILKRLCQIWGKDFNKVKESDPIGKYIKGGPGVMSAYAQRLNDSPEFKPDGLNLQTNDTAFVATVGQLISAIAHWYSTH